MVTASDSSKLMAGDSARIVEGINGLKASSREVGLGTQGIENEAEAIKRAAEATSELSRKNEEGAHSLAAIVSRFTL